MSAPDEAPPETRAGNFISRFFTVFCDVSFLRTSIFQRIYCSAAALPVHFLSRLVNGGDKEGRRLITGSAEQSEGCG